MHAYYFVQEVQQADSFSKILSINQTAQTNDDGMVTYAYVCMF